MITTTWQILWMPCGEGRQWVPDEDPQPAAAEAASRTRAKVALADVVREVTERDYGRVKGT
jgi:hypothetical protein